MGELLLWVACLVNTCTTCCCVSPLALCCSNADVSIKNGDGKIALAVAELNEQEAVVQLLKKAPAAKTKESKDTNGKAPAKESKKETKEDVYL